MAGTLYVVATPIGNLEDATFRAVRVLGEVDVIAAEDTRRTSKLLAHYQIRRPLVSLREHNEFRETPKLIARLSRGESVALVSDAGTPGIADPGARLVAAARGAGILVVPIPGPSAVSAALSVSGFPADTFVFLGFPPSSGLAREDWLSRLQHEPGLIVFFESPHRIARTIDDIDTILVQRPIMICREISKINETYGVYHRHAGGLQPESRGEFTVIVGPDRKSSLEADEMQRATALFCRMTEHEKFDDHLASEIVSAFTKVPAGRIRTAVKKGRIAARRRGETSSER